MGTHIIKKHKQQVIGEVCSTWAQYLVQMKKCFSAQNTAHKRLPLHCPQLWPQHECRMVTKSGGEKSECPQAITSILATLNLVYSARCLIPGIYIVFRIA